MANNNTPKPQKTFTTRVPSELLDRVRAVALGIGITPSNVARMALRSGIAEVEKRFAPLTEKPEGTK
mgnify:FL=1